MFLTLDVFGIPLPSQIDGQESRLGRNDVGFDRMTLRTSEEILSDLGYLVISQDMTRT